MNDNKQRNAFTVWEVLGVVALIGVGAAVIFSIFARSSGVGHGPYCTNHLKQVGLGLLQYSQDFDEHLPFVAVSTKSTVLDSKVPFNKQQVYGWADSLYPYIKSVQVYQCSAEKNSSSTSPSKSGFTDYWFNSNLSGFTYGNSKIVQPQITITFGDGNDGNDLTDARYNLPSLPSAWINNQKSPAYRHNGMANYAFLDGHVKALPPDQITNEPTANGKPTFAVK